MREVLAEHPDMIIIDYTLPMAVNDNGRFYNEHGVPFVMGTTGGDREALLQATEGAGTYAVIAPQMGKQACSPQRNLHMLCIYTISPHCWQPEA